MDSLKDKIIKILYDNSETSYGRGSCGELGDSYLSVDSDSFSNVADEIVKLIKPDCKDKC